MKKVMESLKCFDLKMKKHLFKDVFQLRSAITLFRRPCFQVTIRPTDKTAKSLYTRAARCTAWPSGSTRAQVVRNKSSKRCSTRAHETLVFMEHKCRRQQQETKDKRVVLYIQCLQTYRFSRLNLYTFFYFTLISIIKFNSITRYVTVIYASKALSR